MTAHSGGKRTREPAAAFPRPAQQNLHLRLFSRRKESIGHDWFEEGMEPKPYRHGGQREESREFEF